MRSLKIIKITIITVIVISLIMSGIVSSNSNHLNTCCEKHCSICCIIEVAQAIISMIFAVFVCTTASFLVYFFLSRLHKKQFIFVQSSLVFQKVQLNN